MADTKISALTALTGADLAKLDEWPVVDKSDTTMAASGTDKRITSEEVANAFGVGPYQPKISAGAEQWVMPGLIPAINSAGVGTTNEANVLYYEPMIIDHHCQLDALGFGCSTLNGSTNIRLGVYRADEDWQPTSLVVDAGSLLIDTNGLRSIGSLATALTPGRYLRTRWASASNGGTSLFWMAPVSGTWFSTTYNNAVNRISVTRTYGALPSTGDPWTTTAISTTIGMQIGTFCQLS